MNSEAEYLTPAEVAKLLRVSPITVRSWAQKGLLQADITPGGHRRFNLTEVKRFAEQCSIVLPTIDSARPIRVLIVDDDRQFADYLSELLADPALAIERDTAHNGFEAGRKVHTFQPDVVLLDAMMPGLDGFEVCRQIKQDPTTRHIQVVAITGFPTEDNRQRFFAAGASNCLSKPLDVEALFTVLNKQTRTEHGYPK